MRIPSNVGRSEVGINLTPMIDVVFQLIIFFLISSHLVKQEAQMALPLPLADSGNKPAATETRRLTLNVLADGRLLLAGHPVRTQDLSGRLRHAASAAGGPLEVRIRGDRTVAYRHVEPLLLACARAGIWDVSFSVFRTDEVR
ncbi:MAG: ExbD/TolR family protein [Pirellulaceae bacterium]